MAGIVPLLNSEAQSNVDLNNLTPNQTKVAIRYKVNEYSTSNYTFSSDDYNSVVLFTGYLNITVSLTNSLEPASGTEIIFVNLEPSGSSSISTSGVIMYGSPTTFSGEKPVKLTYIGFYDGSPRWILNNNS